MDVDERRIHAVGGEHGAALDARPALRTGVFEGIRSYAVDGEAAIFRLDAHLARFYRSAEVYGMRFHLVQSS